MRREEHRQLSAAGNPLLTGSKYFWLRKKWDLRRSADAEFKGLLQQDLDIGMAWTMKQNFDRFWSYKTWGKALRFLIDWVDLARVCALKPLTKVADLIDKHSPGIQSDDTNKNLFLK